MTTNNDQLVTYTLNPIGDILQFKAEGKRARIVFKRGTTNTPSDGFKKFIKSNLDAKLPDNFGYVLNTSTNRFVKSTELYDKRFKVPKFRKAYLDKTVFNGRLRGKGDIVYSNTITYTDYEIVTPDPVPGAFTLAEKFVKVFGKCQIFGKIVIFNCF